MSKLFSFAGRLDLIKPTLSSLHIYWGTCFIIPEACTHILDQHTSNFCWGKSDNSKYLRPNAWNKVCRPVEQGGLDIRYIKGTAKAAILRQTWFIVVKRKSIWIDWIYARYIKNKSFWTLKIPSDCSWGRRAGFK